MTQVYEMLSSMTAWEFVTRVLMPASIYSLLNPPDECLRAYGTDGYGPKRSVNMRSVAGTRYEGDAQSPLTIYGFGF